MSLFNSKSVKVLGYVKITHQNKSCFLAKGTYLNHVNLRKFDFDTQNKFCKSRALSLCYKFKEK